MCTLREFRCLIAAAVLLALVAPAGMAAGLPASSVAASPANSQEAGTARVIVLPTPKNVVPLALYVAPSKSKLLSAVLVLFPEAGQDPKTLLNEPAWQNFAEDHQLGLVAVADAPRASSSANATPLPAGVDQASIVLKNIDHELGSGLPLLLYSWPQRTTPISGAILASNAKRVLAWCFRVPDHLPDAGKATPPGIVVCYKENKPAYDALLADFVQARKKAVPLTWIALPGDKPAGSSLPTLDTFVRNDFAAVLHPKVGTEQWQNIDTKLTISAMDLGSHPEKASYLPHFTLATAWAALHVPGGPELAQLPIIEREEDTNNRQVPKIHFYLRRPVSASKEGAQIEGVLAFCTWKKDRAELVGRLQNRNDFLVRYAEEHRLALLTWDTATAYSLKESADQRSQQENFKDDQNFDKIANAWERGTRVLCRENGLRETDFLLYGISRGAQWAHRIALRKPEHFLAVHIHINSSYDLPTPAAKNILWLQTTGEREYGYEAAKRFYARCRELDYPIIFKAGENLGHSDSPQIEALGLRFFDYALEVKARRDSALANAKSLRGKHASPGMYALSGLGETPFYGDFINQEVCNLQEKDMVPASQRVPLPNEALARAWLGRTITPALQAVSNPAPTITASSGNKAQHLSSVPSPSSMASVASVKGNASTQADKPAPATTLPTSSLSKVEPVDFAIKYHLAVQHAIKQYPELAQAASAPNVAFLTQYHRLKEAGDPLLADPSWPEQVAQMVREQEAVRPDFAKDFQSSIERAVRSYPALAQPDSSANTAFLAEYRLLKEANDPLLSDPTWPEQVARTVAGQGSGK